MEFITYEVEGQIGIITINRPKALNALNSAVLDELDKTLDTVDQEAIRCLILTGAGEKSFVAGRRYRRDEHPDQGRGRSLWQKGQRCVPQAGDLPHPRYCGPSMVSRWAAAVRSA